MHLKVLLVLSILSLPLIAAGAEQAPNPSGKPATALANPASVHCEEIGGRLVIQTRPDGGQYGVCLFEDDRQCEEWALLRGDCPEGGLKVTGYRSEAQIYCAITGGKVERQAGTCLRADGQRCPLEANFTGRCPASP